MESTPPPPPPPPPAPLFPPSSPAPSSPPAPRNWWQRNWRWFVPMGCLTLLVLFVLFVGSIVLLVFGAMKSSDVYKTAVARAEADPRVQAALGSDIREGMFPSGNVHVTGPSGKAEMAISISGRRGKGTIYLVAVKSAGEWHYRKLLVKTESGQTIDLTTEKQPANPEQDEEETEGSTI